MRDLLERVGRYCADHDLLPAGAGVLVAVSGGADSLVLLHLLRDLGAARALRLAAATLDHGIRGAASAADVAFVQQTCADWGVPVIVGRADVPQIARDYGWGLEDAARRVRYTFLRRATQIAGAGRIAVGHHRDDQAETVLLHLIRGSGLAGLRGMLPAGSLPAALDAVPEADLPLSVEHDQIDPAALPEHSASVLIRPLLDISRAEIEAYAAAHGLCPREDATNRDPAYRRNRLRHEVIPLLATLNPAVSAAMARLADSVREDYARLETVWQAAYAQVVRTEDEHMVTLDRAGWSALHPSDQRAVVRMIVTRLQPVPRDVTSDHVEAALRLAMHGQSGKTLMLPGGVCLLVTRTSLTFAPGTPADALLSEIDAPRLDQSPGLEFRAGEVIERWFGAWVFTSQPLTAPGQIDAIHADPLAAVLAIPVGTPLVLRQRQPGDVFRPRGLAGHGQKLKVTLNALGVPACWRDYVPLLVADGVLAWFVAPTAAGVRGRVSDAVAIPARTGMNYDLLVMRWSKAP